MQDVSEMYTPLPADPTKLNVLVLGMEYVTKQVYDSVTDFKAQARRDYIRLAELVALHQL